MSYKTNYNNYNKIARDIFFTLRYTCDVIITKILHKKCILEIKKLSNF